VTDVGARARATAIAMSPSPLRSCRVTATLTDFNRVQLRGAPCTDVGGSSAADAGTDASTE
jgi:hypothetical protein